MPEDVLVTYRRADGELIDGEYAFVTDLDFFDDPDEQVELIEEHWLRRSELSITVGNET